jgi:diguanylate cyclase (GGDEF)-like protein
LALDVNRIDCVVLDYNLLAENGMDVYARVQKRGDKAPPVVMLTGTEGERVVIKAYRLGLDDFVLKRDLRISELLGAIDRAVSRRDEQDNRAAELDRLQRRSAFDAATGLYSRQEIDHRLMALANSADRRGGQFAVILSTVNEIQSVTDQCGMVVGDHALRAAASRLPSALRAGDICGRYEDATFISLLDTDIDTETLPVICSRIEKALTFEFREERFLAELSVTIGFAVYPDDGELPGELIDAAVRNCFTATKLDGAIAGRATSGNVAAPLFIHPAAADKKEDRRKHQRQRVLKRGRMAFNDGNSTIDCTIRDISAGGARLRVGSEVAVPAIFELVFLESTLRRKVARRWQTGVEIGVEYIS